jgi:flavin-dependent dehydrogenase
VLIVGGGPAGSACASKLRRAGLDVLVVDGAAFPRDKVCAGWITPQVVDGLALDLEAYAHGRTLQPITGFRAGVIGSNHDVVIEYNRPVSYGIRRCEFDHYLLQRSQARQELGAPIQTIERQDGVWIATTGGPSARHPNARFTAPMLVGAGGHWCPVARMLNRAPRKAAKGPRREDERQEENAPIVVAQEAEFPVTGPDAARFATAPDTPELYFSPDLTGYGWCFRKQGYLNVGFGTLDVRSCQKATHQLIAYLKTRQKIPAAASWRWRGHAYLVSTPRRRRVSGDGVLLIGDAAGLAYPQSGEGIRPAVESGLIAAATVIEARGAYTRDRLKSYERELLARLRAEASDPSRSRSVSGSLAETLATLALRVPWFVRHVVLDRWFLRAAESALSA